MKFTGYFASVLILFFGFVGVSAAQHGGGHSGSHGSAHSGSNGSAHTAAKPAAPQATHTQSTTHTQTTTHTTTVVRSNNSGRVVARGAESAHFDGRHFDAGFRGRYFGSGHTFFINRPIFFRGGYGFWYGGFWWGFYNPWPYGWAYEDGVYMEYDPDLDCYFLYNPLHPGVRMQLGVAY